jgi:AraC family transcriptional regulator of arabinose operon
VQTELELVIIYSGQLQASLDKMPFQVQPKSICLLVPGQELFVSYHTASNFHLGFVRFYLAAPLPDIYQRLSRLPRPLPLSPAMVELTHRLAATYSSPLATQKILRKAIAVEMLWLYLGETELVSRELDISGCHPALSRAQEFIQGHLAEPITLAQLSRVAGISPAQLIRLFRAQFNLTPLNFVWNERVKLGVQLLAQPKLSIREIAELSGFQTSYHFSRRVRQLTGVPPTLLRQQYGQLPQED